MSMHPSDNTAPSPIALGPFDLMEVLGRGGMGEVWRGVHRRHRVPVAVKVVSRDVRPKHASRFVAAFLREVQTVAALDHPGIVLVLDYGEVPQETQDRSGGALLARSPYLAMELAPGGSLRDALRQRAFRWAEVRELLLTLLDALAHAHARGVIHRDLKPDNILWCGDEGGGWKLTDFGIAHALHQVRAGSREQSQGTPSYMAPEQIMGRWRDYGPWTDLYALGCLAHQLAAGRLPFEGTTTREVADAHLWRPLPRVKPTIPVPAGFEEWISRLLMKEPEERFQFAADAATSLRGLSSPPPLRSDPSRETVVQGPTPELMNVSRRGVASSADQTAVLTSNGIPAAEGSGDEALLTDSGLFTVDRSSSAELAVAREVEAPTGSDAQTRVLKEPPKSRPVAPVTHQIPYAPPPPPSSWREAERQVPRRLQALMGAGLGLYGLRSIPMVGREVERDRIWGALREVCEARRARCVVIRGATGLGKSRLASWLCERSHEVGAAVPVKALHSPVTSSGLAQVVGRMLRCIGLSREDTRQRLANTLPREGVIDPWEWDALTELILGVDRSQGSALMKAPAERYGVAYRLMLRRSRRRAQVVWLDDVQWGGTTLDFVQFVLGAQTISPCSLLFVLTVQEESLAEAPGARRALEAIEEHELVTSLTLRPLADGARERLVGELLGLEAGLAAQVAERSGGNPLFAVQLLGDWVERDLLQADLDGFRLREGAKAALPDDLYAVWAERLRRFLSDRSSAAQVALELAAVLGQEVTDAEWHAACSRAGAPPSYELVLALVDLRLASWTESGWAFAHGMLRESLERLADESGRLQRHHGDCARLLQQLHGEQAGLSVQERLGRHFLAAGVPEEALAPLYRAARQRYWRSDYRQALALLKARDKAQAELGLGDDDIRVGEGILLRSKVELHLGRYDASLSASRRVERSAKRAGWTSLQARALRCRATVAASLGRFDEARDLYQEAKALFEACGDLLGWARCERGRGSTFTRLGDRVNAQAAYQRALERFEALNDLEGICRSTQGMAELLQHEGELEQALSLYEDTLVSCEDLGSRYLTVISLNGVAEVDRLMGRFDAAEARYRRILEISEAVGSVQTQVARINIALALICQARYSEARVLLDELTPELEAAGRSGLLGGVHAELLPCVASEGDWSAFDRHLNMASTLLNASGAVDPDDAWPAQLAGEMAVEAGMLLRGERALRLARKLWGGLGRDEKLAEIDAVLERLDG